MRLAQRLSTSGLLSRFLFNTSSQGVPFFASGSQYSLRPSTLTKGRREKHAFLLRAFSARGASSFESSPPGQQKLTEDEQTQADSFEQSLPNKMLRRFGLNLSPQQLLMFERVNIIMISTFLNSACHTALSPVLPIFALKFGIGAAAVGMTISIFAIARLLLNMPAGIAADKYGRKPLLVWGPFITAIGMCLCGMARTYTELLIYRFITGIGSALQMCGAQLYLADVSIRENRARVLGANTSAALLGVSVGPALGGVMAESMGTSAPFFVTGSLAGLAAVWSAIRLKESHPSARRRQNSADEGGHGDRENHGGAHESLESRGSMDSAPMSPSGPMPVPPPIVLPNDVPPGRASTTADLEQGRDPLSIRLSTPRPGREGALSPEGGLAPPAPEATPGGERDSKGGESSGRDVWWTLIHSRDFLSVSLVNSALFASANGGRGLIMPLAAMEGFQWNPGQVGTLLSAMAAINLVGTYPASYLSDKLGRKATIVPAGFGMALAMALSALTDNPTAFALAWIVYAMSQSVLGASPQAFAADLMSANNRGLALSFYRTWGDIGLLLGPLALGAVMDRAGGGLDGTRAALMTNAAALTVAVGNFMIAAREPDIPTKRNH